jgi:hypothetical protein
MIAMAAVASTMRARRERNDVRSATDTILLRASSR